MYGCDSYCWKVACSSAGVNWLKDIRALAWLESSAYASAYFRLATATKNGFAAVRYLRSSGLASLSKKSSSVFWAVFFLPSDPLLPQLVSDTGSRITAMRIGTQEAPVTANILLLLVLIWGLNLGVRAWARARTRSRSRRSEFGNRSGCPTIGFDMTVS